MAIRPDIRRLDEVHKRRLALGVFGVSMIVAGAFVPGTNTEAVNVLILVGSFLVAAAILFEQFSNLELDFRQLRFGQREGVTPRPWLVAEADVLNRIARTVPERARDIAEDALEKVHRHRMRIPPERREFTTLQTLVALLDKADHELWLDDRQPGPEPAGPLEAFQRLDFSKRIAYALRREFPPRQVAEILERPESDINEDIHAVRAVIRPYVANRHQDPDDR